MDWRAEVEQAADALLLGVAAFDSGTCPPDGLRDFLAGPFLDRLSTTAARAARSRGASQIHHDTAQVVGQASVMYVAQAQLTVLLLGALAATTGREPGDLVHDLLEEMSR